MKTTGYNQEFVDKIIRMLSEIPYFEGTRHLGRPFLTSYQIAIAFKHLHPKEFANIGLPISAADTSDEMSLARHIAQNLSQAVKDHNPNIEGAVLSYQHLEDMTLDNDGEVVRPSRFPVTLFRYREEKKP
jgi:hypothetical protein